MCGSALIHTYLFSPPTPFFLLLLLNMEQPAVRELRLSLTPCLLLQCSRRSDYGLREPQPDRTQDVDRRGRSPEGVPAGHDPLSLVALADCQHMEIIGSVLFAGHLSPCSIPQLRFYGQQQPPEDI